MKIEWRGVEFFPERGKQKLMRPSRWHLRNETSGSRSPPARVGGGAGSSGRAARSGVYRNGDWEPGRASPRTGACGVHSAIPPVSTASQWLARGERDQALWILCNRGGPRLETSGQSSWTGA